MAVIGNWELGKQETDITGDFRGHVSVLASTLTAVSVLARTDTCCICHILIGLGKEVTRDFSEFL